MAENPFFAIAPVGVVPRQIMRFAFCLIAALWTYVGGALAEDFATVLQRKYRRLQGEEAVRFLVGNSLVDSDGEVDYFLNDSTAMSGRKAGQDCTVFPWKFIEDKNCSFQSVPRDLKKPCIEFHVLAAKSALRASPKPGALIGYYLIGNYVDLKWDSIKIKRGEKRKIFAGDVTHCPMARQPTQVQALEIPATDKSVPDELVGPPDPGETGSPGAVLEKLLVGNSIVWPKVSAYDCGMVNYFGRDGRIYILDVDCDVSLRPRSDRPVLGIDASRRWKRIGALFCLENVETKGQFTDCDSFILKAYRAETGTASAAKRLHVFLGPSEAGGAYDKKAGLLVKGNPAGFAFH